MSSSSESSSHSDTAPTTPISPTDSVSAKPPLYTTASVFLRTLSEAGITHIFANWGNDHPAILEDLERQRSEGDGRARLEVVTCPNEMVALSAAQGYAQVTGKPAAVIVHVDVGTQALAGAVHNVDKGNTPVIIFAGASPFTVSGELKGSKNEWPMWGQDALDQPAIVRQFMRHTTQIMSGKAVAKTVMRAWQFATSAPKGPVYLWARREVLEEEVDESVMNAQLDVAKWPPIAPSGLSPAAVRTIVEALSSARFPMIIVASAGRNHRTVPLLQALSHLRSVGVFLSVPQYFSIPYSHPYLIGQTFDGTNPYLEEADVVITLDTEIPYMPANGSRLRPDARVFVIDFDPLKQQMGWSHIDAELICRADAHVALGQLVNAIHTADAEAVDDTPLQARLKERGERLKTIHDEWIGQLVKAESHMSLNGQTPNAPHILGTVREVVRAQTVSRGENVLWLNEGISNCHNVWNHIRPEKPGQMIMSGGSSLGWALGAATGARLGARVAKKDYELITAVVGDGTYLFGVPSTAYWLSRRYNAPFLTIVLNNGGWASPRNSMLGVHPHGLGSKASARQLSVSFGPDMADYAGIAAAAGGAWGRRVTRAEDVQSTLEEAVRVVVQEKRSAVVDFILDQI
ncbi:Thiamin diphosphate-binding protein [Daedalea quercina L-15889]|uniref:Thiamin diphosphate-binding protein n=1 Tax=Daedalea quercina L-15889 TaxID=1314783 RepID=A0A165QJE0_9APHY|nr:Thiamin diphosphate-binding protein [Daedalea quercina L-15889]